MQIITEVVVGSRLHNLYNEKSDYDIRGIFMHPLKDLVSPFKKIKNTSWIEGDEDNTAYELREFCKMATQGNPTVLEILWSNQIRQDSATAKTLRDNRHKFLDSRRIFEAHKGYAHNQYTKMNLFAPDARTPKFSVAYLRSLEQAKQLLATGEFNPQVTGELREFLMDVKYNFRDELVPELSRRFAEMQVELADVFAKYHDQFKPDFDWIEEFVYYSYISNPQDKE